MTTGNSSLLRDYRGAIALNNIGVSLLERRAYRQAVETLKDAITFMKHVFRPQVVVTPGATFKSSSLNVDARVAAAMERLECPQSSPTLRDPEDLVVQDSLQPSSIRAAALEGISSSFTMPIRIEAADSDSPENRDPDLESAIMLYNFGIAHLCLSKLSRAGLTKFRDGALKLFNMSYSIISNKNALAGMNTEEIRKLSETRVLLAIVVLNNLVRVQTEMGKHAEANESYQRLVRLGSAVREQRQGESVDSASAAPAA
jgi:hypothetical protein